MIGGAMDLAWLPTVMALHWSALVTPGVNVLLVSQLAAGGQRRAALAAGLGITTVACLWAGLALLGIVALMEALPWSRPLLQAAGAGYLGWVATRLWRAGLADPGRQGAAVSARSAYRLGVLTNLLNPKSVYFFAAIGAAVPSSSLGPPARALVIGVVALNAMLWHGFVALVLSTPRVQAAYRRRAGLLSRLAAALVATVALHLLWQALQRAPA